MGSRLLDYLQDPLIDYLQAPSDDPGFIVSGNAIQANFTSAAGSSSSIPSSGASALTSVAAVSAGGITINLLFDAAAMAAPASFRAGIQQAAAILASTISDQITVNLNIDYSGTGGGASAGPNGQFESYSWVTNNLTSHATQGDTTFNALPSGTSVQGRSNVSVWNAELKLWGVLGANDSTTDDGGATFATDINSNSLVGVALHELTHALGRVNYGPQPDVFDLFRFTSPGVRLFQGSATAPAAYFSLDGGNTKLADYGQTSDASDFLNSGVQGSTDPFNEFYDNSTQQQLTAIDLMQLDALGFHLTVNNPVVIESAGSISLVQVGMNYFLDAIGTSTGPELRSGAAIVAGQCGGWTPIGVEQTASGYEVAWKLTGTSEYTVWATDGNGNYTSNLIGTVSGTDAALESIETSFHQDLNGDGTIGPVTTVIEAFGGTKLVQVGSNYFLNPVAGGTGPELKNGSAIVAGQCGGWTPIGAEQTASGYEVAWKLTGTSEYSVWATDGNGNYTSSLTGTVSGTDAALESIETSFHQDLNGDGTIGPVTTVIEAFGGTKLVQVGSNYFLNPVAGGTGPELRSGAAIVAGQCGGWTPIGAEQTASGYEVAWKLTGTSEYSVWATDGNGNYITSLIGTASGTDAALQTIETSFHQDLNGDGTIGPVTTVIEAFGATSLVQVGSNYFLNPVAGGTGPELKNGAAIVVGQCGGWTPIGAEQTASGYEIAWKLTGTSEYSVWATDGNGNYITSLIGAASGTDAALESIETSFHQDLNGDGVIGMPSAATSAAAQSAATSSGQTTFDGTILTLQQPSAFAGQIVGFTGDGTLVGSDQIDLRGLHYNSPHFNFDSSAGTLSVGDGSTTASLQFVGQYTQNSFHFADDGNGGTFVVAATVPGQNGSTIQSFGLTAQDTFVFAPNFGQISITNFAPATDTLQFSKSVFADLTALLAATHDDASGNAVITDAAHDTITLQHVTTAQMLAHQADFHFV